ncbi:MAG TPA: SGNH/GDSL hydrolase family protein [Acidobacteriaceae bacterium]|nr:SGNH/GDSL hydrolase family protein [Acidobacteriaceae bacterium]
MRSVNQKWWWLPIWVILLMPVARARPQTSGQSLKWIGSWAAAMQTPEPQNALPENALRDATLRQIVHLSAGGTTLRVHISNAFGKAPLHLTSVHIARPLSLSSSAIDPASDRALSFSGRADVTVPSGAEYISDPISYAAPALSSLAITFHLNGVPGGQTAHPGSRATSYLVQGDFVSAAKLKDATRVEHWYQIAGIDVDVESGPNAASVIALGDSITDGHGSTTNANDRWTDVLAERLQSSAATRNVSVLNQGIGGNHLLTDGLGPNALARFDRDVLAQSSAKYLIVAEGVNDLGSLARQNIASPGAHTAMVQNIIGAYQQIIVRAHSHGIRVIGATILPYIGSLYYQPGPENESDRKAVNQWIRAPGHFDQVVDFDRVLCDPEHPDRLRPSYDSGDHLHPSPAGYRAMADSVPLASFR